MPPMHVKHELDNFVEPEPEMATHLKRVCLIVNPASGNKKGLKTEKIVTPLLEAGGCTVTVVYTEYAGHAKVLANAMDLSDVDVFAPIGGDGTVHETVNGFMTRADFEEVRERVVIAIIPGGTGNTLAYDLHVNSPKKAVELIIEGSTRRVDVGKVLPLGAEDDAEAVYSINIIGWGLSSTVLSTADSLRWMGGAQYKLAGYLSLLRNKAHKATIIMVDADGNEVEKSGKYVMVQAQVTAHMGTRYPFCKEAKLDDGLLDLTLIDHRRVGRMVKVMAAGQKGSHTKFSNVTEYQVRSFKLIPDEGAKLQGSKAVNVDGELAAPAPFEATVIPKAIRFVGGK